ncbi:MAG TPA: glutamate racemase [Candidatus Eisenbacteria bacterium]|uniref:Glutamate racemase n=1 Tax=Eiseniibacteriota bacterium TaxID=2212470 RepID=A0A7V2F336_UNCEI|nr:glutamate racemase [Candidatus Eisenbacteria bacterium]
MGEEAGKPIGVFDSGIGGLTVVRELMQRLPNEEIVYFGDTARLPYGTKSPETVLRFSRQNLSFLKDRNVKLIVVACNTASSVALSTLVEEEEMPVVGVLLPGARAAARTTRNKRVGVIGTPATIRSGAYEQALREIEPGIEIWSLPCPLFVPLAEEGWLDNEVTYLTAKYYLEPLASFGADTLVLGCTHYPLLAGVIGRVVGEKVALVDSARETALEVERILSAKGLGNDSGVPGKIHVYVSDVPYLIREVGERFLGRPIERIERVSFQ